MRSPAGALALVLIVALAAPAAHAQLAVDADTVALWHLDEGSGTTAFDAGALGYALAFLRYPGDGSAGSLFPIWTEGCDGTGVYFFKGDTNNQGGYLYRNQAHTFQNQLSIEMMLRTTSTNAYLFFGGFIQFYLSLEMNGRIRMQVGDGNAYGPAAISDVAVNDGLWHYLAGTYDGTNVRIYVDGEERAIAAYDGTIGTATGLFVGGRPSNTFLEGAIDEVRLSDVARGGAEIAAAWDQLAVLCPEPDGGLAAAAASLAVLAVRRPRR